jgi:putative flippase GtrA
MIRWLKFNAVGVAGAAVQLAVLWLLNGLLGVQYVLATVLAVETAVLHNFAWHQAWTWRELPSEGWQRRLVRFHVANGLASIASNAALTFVFRHYLGMPVLVANFAAIGITALLNFTLAHRWVFRIVILIPVIASAAVFTTTLQEGAAVAFNKYVDRFEHSGYASRPVLTDLSLTNLNPSGKNDGADLPNGYIHHWIGAIVVPNTKVARVRRVLEDYDHYTAIYPDVKIASASKLDANSYDVRLVSEQAEKLALRFAFDTRFRVVYRTVDDFTLVESRSYRIRESSSGYANTSEWMPEGKDHGIVWRLNAYWRLKQTGTSVYAECQVISLSRKPLLGMSDLVQSRAKNSLGATLRQTRDRAMRPD